MSSPAEKPFRTCLALVLVLVTLVTSSCKHDENGPSCQPGDSNYPECLDA